MIALRPATAADADAIAAVFSASRRLLDFLPELHSVAEDRQFIAEVVLRDCTVTVAEADRRIAGFIAGRNGWIEQLYVAPTAIGTGIGAALLADAMARNGALELWCFARNTAARRFYERHGFVAVEFTDGADNEARAPDVRYRWVRPDGAAYASGR